ncbi:TRAP transporter small permease [Pseudohoeflea coraliihabitans]|uniref:TRAP transporter small permease protein n=1 Tax=Pseudohoeflea coraliihabitans TaxID=2860393 RepID=A0ABS6WSL6_9HYPH|nr:TRAP transporter small permease [Pseudohoeflea sp. DP4N28-3]MBW3098968.1 TRAP transporter small permease [Pseudohoeflea sp. DP4N28-3]
MLYRIGRALARILDATQVIAAILVIAMMVHIVLDVVIKFTTSQGFPATVEIVTHYYMVGVAFLPVAFAERMNAHISVEVLTQTLSDRLQNFALYISWLLSIVVYSVLTYRTFLDAEKKRDVVAFIFTQGVRIDIWPSYYFLPIGFALMTLTLVYRCVVFFLPANDGLGGGRGSDEPGAKPAEGIVE